jgi:5S rRNA maturation endonuclease (ribonuclease M5)
MTHIIEQQNLYLQTTKHRAVRNLNDIYEEINLEVNIDVDMDGAGTTIREIFMTHLDNRGNALFHSMERTNTSGVYRLMFDETNTVQVDTLLANIDESVNALGDWDNTDAHFRHHSNKKVNIVGIQPRGEKTEFWKKHFAVLVKATIPTEIDTAHLH